MEHVESAFRGGRRFGALLLLGSVVMTSPWQSLMGQANQTWINGSGTWDTTSNFWDGGTPWVNGNNAIFGGSGETVNLGSGVTVNNLTFNSDGFIVADPGAAGVLSLGAASVISVPTVTDTATISEDLTVGGIDKQGDGTLILSGSNSFDGAVTVTDGRLTIETNSGLGSTVGDTSVVSGAQLRLGDGVTVTGETLSIAGSGIDFSGALNAGSGTTAVWDGPIVNSDARVGAADGATLTLSGPISGNALTFSSFGTGVDAGTVVISGTSNVYTGNTNIIRGVVQLGATDALPTATILRVDTSTAAEDSIFDLGGFNQEVAGLERANTTGGGAIITNSGGSAATLTVNQAAGTRVYDGSFEDGASTVNVTKIGNGRLTLGGASTTLGEFRVEAGELLITNPLALGDTAGQSVAISAGRIVLDDGVTVSGETARISGNGGNNFGAIQSASGATATWDGPVQLFGNTRMSGGTGGTLNVNGVISNGSGAPSILFSRANDAVTVLNAVNTYTGDTQMFASGGSGATLRLGVDNAIDRRSRFSMLTANATRQMNLDFNGFDLTLRALDSSSRHDRGNLVLFSNEGGSPSVFTLSGTVEDNDFTGVIADGTGGMSVVKEGASAQTLLGSNTYTGSTTVREGILRVGRSVSTFGSTGSLASTEFQLEGGTLEINNVGADNQNNDRLADSAVLHFTGGGVDYAGSDQAATDSSETVGSLSFDSGISEMTVRFGGTNLAELTAGSIGQGGGGGLGFVRGVNLGQDGTITASVARVFSTAAPSLVGNTAALPTGINAGAQNTQIVPFLLGSATATSGGLGTEGANPNTFLTYEATTGLRPLNPTDEFTNNAVVAGDNIRITSATTANASVAINSLILDGADFNIGSGQTVSVTSGAILFASGSGVDLGGGAGTLDLGSTGVLVTINSTGNSFIRPQITGSAGMSFFGSGRYIPGNGSSNYSGDTLLQVDQVIPVVSSSGPAGAPTSGPFGTGRVILDGSGIRSTTGQDTTIGNPISLRSNTRILPTGDAKRLLLTGAVTLEEGDRTIRNDSTADTLFSGIIGDGGNGFGFTVEGSGTGSVVLEAANTYTGPTRVVSSGLSLGSGASIAAGSALTVDGATAVLSGEGTVFGPASILTGSLLPGGSAGADAGLMTFGDDLSLAGALLMDVNGLSRGATSGYDALDITGALAYGGTISLNFTSTFVEGDLFDLFDFGSASGSFTDFSFTGSYTGNLTNQLDGTWSGVLGGDAFQFTESTGVLSIVPEPGRVSLVMVGLLLAVFRRRR